MDHSEGRYLISTPACARGLAAGHSALTDCVTRHALMQSRGQHDFSVVVESGRFRLDEARP
jgi:hypothetical protein